MTTSVKERNGHATAISNVSNDGELCILTQTPYRVEVKIKGDAALLMHRWSDDDVAAKSAAAKNSAAKKTDNLESYVYRCPDKTIGIPGTYLIGSIINKSNGAAKYLQDPRSPRKSALDLYKAGVVSLTELASLGVKEWDYLDRRRVVIQQSAITRVRPAMLAGWELTFVLMVMTPEFISPSQLQSVLTQAGRLVGIGDFRPTFGRFQVTSFQVLD